MNIKDKLFSFKLKWWIILHRYKANQLKRKQFKVLKSLTNYCIKNELQFTYNKYSPSIKLYINYEEYQLVLKTYKNQIYEFDIDCMFFNCGIVTFIYLNKYGTIST